MLNKFNLSGIVKLDVKYANSGELGSDVPLAAVFSSSFVDITISGTLVATVKVSCSANPKDCPANKN